MAADLQRINNTIGKMAYYLGNHQCICVGVSGGSDSNIIVHMIAKNFREYLPKIHFVFQNTGLEFKATLRHLEYMEQFYGISIERIRGESVVTVCKRDGFPILSKNFSQKVEEASKGQASALKRVTGNCYKEDGTPSRFNFSKKQQVLAKYILENHIKVSSRCCDLSKKRPFHKYLKSIKADLNISGERRCEGGQRAQAHSNCFETGKYGDKYMPLFFWDDETKQYYKEKENIKFSDCYEIWGMKRTGCVGCPFNSKVREELELIKKYEPNLYNACINVFGDSYKLLDEFNMHKEKILSHPS